EWGIPIPGEKRGKSIYVWFDAVIGYLSATKEFTDNWEKYWKNDEAETYYFIGKDNIPFHSIIWPAMLLGMKSNLNLPYCVSANEFLNLEGKQFSTSRNWAVWLNKLDFEADLLRYYLTAIMPEKGDSNFTWDNLKEKINEELIATLGNFVHRVLTLVESNFGEIPHPDKLSEEDKELLDFIDKKSRKTGKFIDNREFKKALQEAMSLAKQGNRYLSKKEPWNQDDPKNSLYVSTRIVNALAILIAPFMPSKANEIWQMLGKNEDVTQVRWEKAREDLDNRELGDVNPLFEKLDKEEIEKEKSKLGKEEEEEMNKISLDDFQNVEMKIGQVLDAESIEGSDNLIKLNVDIGDEERQLVAGLAQTHKIEELKGRKVVVLTNLEEAEIFGVKSQGMVLAAEEDGEPILLEPEDQDVEIGSPIK
ncbi:methionine--tRNA ligase subunit beta, partial [archaeon SCG-AAA382B04]